MTEVRALHIMLHERRVGTITALEGDRSIFTFAQDYVEDAGRDTLSLSFKERYGGLYTADNRAYQTRLQPFFSNLLPEGALREFLAQRDGLNAMREFPMLAALGLDLPGALRAVPAGRDAGVPIMDDEVQTGNGSYRFSLAGVQLKFSALRNQGKDGGLTIPLNGEGGSWIIKLPSTRLPEVPENEYAMMWLAGQIGIEIPEIDLVRLETIKGLPDGIARYGDTAFAIRRFDRSSDGPVHIEDFAQVYRIYPEAKYDKASYRALLSALATQADSASVDQFVRRLTFCVLIGNGDMHLKNWSLIYPDRRTPQLSPAYDLLSTIPYLPGDEAALKFRRSKAWASFTLNELAMMADQAALPQRPIVEAARETIARFDQIWAEERNKLSLSAEVINAIERHRKNLAI
ncbi:type II toxin-antitoxin system HipA family toxin [Sphingobium yanoikuyae]|uniref:Kinase n=1 Tax=Sphingobium yanoikuyae TaxID=13690 RepID=A0A291MZH6_SPHYA|nr:type II toxin-antitoxin system HipA family toxin [Sphingobium yanoikuyae]ATI80564.1 kinase [Sphingobium yanoikuyae]